MWFRGEIKCRSRAPAPDFNVLVGCFPNGNALMRDVRDSRKQLPQPVVVILGSLFLLLNFLALVLGLSNQGAGVLAALFQLGDVLRGPISPRFQGLGFGNELAALGVDLAEIPEDLGWIHSPLPKLLFHQGQVVKIGRASCREMVESGV